MQHTPDTHTLLESSTPSLSPNIATRHTELLILPNQFEIGDDITHSFLIEQSVLFVNGIKIVPLTPDSMNLVQSGFYLGYKDTVSEPIALLLSAVHDTINFASTDEWVLELIDALIIRLFNYEKPIYSSYCVQDGELSSHDTNATFVFMDDDDDIEDLLDLNFTKMLEHLHL